MSAGRRKKKKKKEEEEQQEQQQQQEEEEEDPEVEGKLVRGEAVIEDSDMCRALEARGFGDGSGRRFVLAPFESLYLVYAGRLALKRNNAVMDFGDLMQIYKKTDRDILTRFLIYRDLRTRGYVVKDGFGFGSDFRVYGRGHFGEKGAKYLVFAFNEGRQERIGAFHKKVSDIARMGKEPIIAVLERRGEVIYYRVSGMDFAENRSGTGDRTA